MLILIAGKQEEENAVVLLLLVVAFPIFFTSILIAWLLARSVFFLRFVRDCNEKHFRKRSGFFSRDYRALAITPPLPYPYQNSKKTTYPQFESLESEHWCVIVLRNIHRSLPRRYLVSILLRS